MSKHGIKRLLRAMRAIHLVNHDDAQGSRSV